MKKYIIPLEVFATIWIACWFGGIAGPNPATWVQAGAMISCVATIVIGLTYTFLTVIGEL